MCREAGSDECGEGGGSWLSLVGVGVGGEGLFLEEDGVVGKAWF